MVAKAGVFETGIAADSPSRSRCMDPETAEATSTNKSNNTCTRMRAEPSKPVDSMNSQGRTTLAGVEHESQHPKVL
ncbi:uncharacterized protein Z519_01482 [Cladophialophora bantiana CBS 173.52]|uniref:Uncharacterized protein n=1 Tax=Cladophialophora bantiana (strain ATCC 10958 / CBS 173.52 / CDC B-1940 / NIH 8579) TaxID=1442370 RepID=A0A0D2HWY9_CLAB1|nr:uncharacterized protein Z519_01482 [Cladophialophora bantiana CBS 173.52]KIW97898.1 hypothetical protein Z519_01482 [Cladophialophora bantiana CBS 173.52]